MIELFVQVLQLEQQIFIWIGESPASLTELAVGIPSADSTASRYECTASSIGNATGLFSGPGSVRPHLLLGLLYSLLYSL
jgi:hypothetical protein